MNNIISFFRKAFPVKRRRIIQGTAIAVLLCMINILTPMLISVKLSAGEVRVLIFLFMCLAAGLLWAGKLFLNLEIVGWTMIGYTIIGAVLTVISPDRFAISLIAGLCGLAVYTVVFYITQKQYLQ